MNSGILNTFYL
jgi:hypothetical protein